MPSSSNPVSSNPVSGASQSKSLRSRLGFGGSTPNNSLVKPSFFSQLKSARKSLVGPSELSIQDQTVLLIDQDGVMEEGRKHTRNILLDDSTPSGPAPTIGQGFGSHSRATDFRADLDKPITKITQNDPDGSGVSKQLPDLSVDHPLLLDEPLPSDTASYRGGHHGSQESVINIGTPPESMRDHGRSKPGGSRDTQMDQCGAKSVDRSFSFSDRSPRLSLNLDLVIQDITDPWSKPNTIQNDTVSSADSSALLNADESSLLPDGNAPITSTPFVSRKTSLLRPPPQEPEEEVSFDFDGLDPDLVALLRPNNFNNAASRKVTPLPSEPSSPSPDPLNLPIASPPVSPLRRLSRIPVKPDHLSSSHVRRNSAVVALTPSVQPPSPARAIRPPRTYSTQDVFPPSHAPKPTAARSHIPWLEANASEAAAPSSGPSTVSSSDLGTPSDASKQPSPLTAPPLTLNEPHRTPDFPWSNVSASASQTAIHHKSQIGVPTRHSPVPTPGPSPAIDSRPTSRFIPRSGELRPTSASPETLNSSPFGSLGRERNRTRPPIDAVINMQSNPASTAGRPISAFRTRTNSTAALPQPRNREGVGERRYRKRSMSLDQSPNFGDDVRPQEITRSRFTRFSDRRFTESAGYNGSEYAYSVADSVSTAYEGREPDRDRERYTYGSGDRERVGRAVNTDWLGPRTAKAFAAAGLLDDRRDIAGIRSMIHSRNGSEREYRTPISLGGRDKSSPMSSGFPSTESERDRDPFRFSSGTSTRSGERELRYLGGRAGASSPNLLSSRPLSRADSWSNSRPAPVFARAISDLVSRRNSVDGRDSASSVHPRTTSTYSISAGYGESTGSGGGRASPTTPSSVFAQSQIQSLKEKHDSQTEALLAALADSQKTCRELRSENDGLKSQVKDLEDRLVAAISGFKEKEKELQRVRRLYSPDRTRTSAIKSTQDHLQAPRHGSPPRSILQAVSPPKARPVSTSSSIFPSIPNSMSLLISERPESPAQGSLESAASPPPSPTLVLPKLAQKQGANEQANGSAKGSSQAIPMSHKRSMSGASVATSANFSIRTGSPGSLKLKPEHEILLGDMTELSLTTGLGEESDAGQ
ncbi:hypothetical protein BU17DRAFT_69348 [Hysterangium stoloniferum]|nr:hypothetical protein BU17DRAFT_69348 [Hysterangium stoloniferum]